MGRRQNKNIEHKNFCLSYLSAFLTILGQGLRRSYKKNECIENEKMLFEIHEIEFFRKKKFKNSTFGRQHGSKCPLDPIETT